ncbi:MAG: DUF1780 domain-containing protein [Hydrogenophaga sp.]|nr:DUF1780 domain-containing protein [Hydrogenophaga sp.]
MTVKPGYVPDPPSEDDDRFSRAFKAWREWNVGVQFLTNLHFGVDDANVFCVDSDPPDVVFADARFEVKEILDEGRRRHDEVKADRARSMQSPGKLNLVSYTPKDLFPEDVGSLVLTDLQRLQKKRRYTPDLRKNLDLLFYVNKLKHWFDNGAVPDSALFAPYGWRSVSALINSQTSIVFMADDSAPCFLRENVGRVRERWEPLD